MENNYQSQRKEVQPKFRRPKLQRLITLQPNIIGTKERPIGIDTSHWSGEVLTTNKEADFLYTKLTEGIYYRDTGVDKIWDNTGTIPIRGLYHYQRSGQSWQAQSEFFLANAQPFVECKFYVLDFEPYGNDLNSSFLSDIRRIITDWRQKRPDIKPFLYTNKDMLQNYIYPYFIETYADGQFWLDQLDLAYAQYYYNPSPDNDPDMARQRDPDNWTIYQYTEKGDGSLYKVQEKYVDLNVFNGTLQELYDFFNTVPPIEPPIEPPPIGDDMKYGRMKTFTNIRTSMPGGSYQDVGDLHTDDLVEASTIELSNGNPWWQITKATRNGQPVITSNGQSVEERGNLWCYGVNVEETTEPTDPTNPPVIEYPATGEVTIEWDDGTLYKGTVTKQ